MRRGQANVKQRHTLRVRSFHMIIGQGCLSSVEAFHSLRMQNRTQVAKDWGDVCLVIQRLLSSQFQSKDTNLRIQSCLSFQGSTEEQVPDPAVPWTGSYTTKRLLVSRFLLKLCGEFFSCGEMLLFLRKVSNLFYVISKEDYSPEPNLENKKAH